MAEDNEPADNIDRLLTHLKDGSLAARLVRAYREPHPEGPAGSMKTVLDARLEEERGKRDGPKD